MAGLFVHSTHHARILAAVSTSLSNTRDKLRGARDRSMVLGGSDPVAADLHHAPPRLQPPLVSFIALLGGAAILFAQPSLPGWRSSCWNERAGEHAYRVPKWIKN